MPPPRAALLLLPVVATAGCTRLLEQFNVPPLRSYAAVLVKTSGARVELRDCAMFGQSRAGYCLLSGAPGELSRFAAALKLEEAPAAGSHGDQTCLLMPDFGRPQAQPGLPRAAPLAGTREFKTGGPLPPNSDNVRFRRLYTNPPGDRGCLELEYPYG